MTISDEVLSSILTNSTYLSSESLQSAKVVVEDKKMSLYEAIIDKGFLTDDQLGEIVADYYKLHFVKLSKEVIDKDVLHLIPEDIAKESRVIAYGEDNDAIKIATSNPKQDELFALLTQKSGKRMVISYTTDREIEETLNIYKARIQTQMDKLLSTDSDKAKDIVKDDLPVEKILENIIQYAYDSKASDIHIEPRKEESLVRLRIDGIMHNILELPSSMHDQIITKIKVESRLRTDEHLASQDGKMQKDLEKELIDIRVSIVPVVHGEAAVLRLLTSHYRQLDLQHLGMNDRDLKIITDAFHKPYGMILSTGPTGSGKTTSMYSILKILNTKERNIATIEDPVEYEIEGLNQIQANTQTNLTFAQGLRSILRQDPDIIYVGEIRDDETAGIAVNSAMTGHLVLSTLHTNDAATSLPRLTDMGIEPFLVSSTVNVIVAQRLVRTICEACRMSYTASLDDIAKHNNKEITKNIFKDKKTQKIRLYKGKGCAVCHNTGYSGRIGIFEILSMTPEIQKLINEKADSTNISKVAIQQGMTTMLVDGIAKVI